MCLGDIVILILIDVDDYDIIFYLLFVLILKLFNLMIFLFIL